MLHAQKLRNLYKRRRDLLMAAASKHLSGLAEWETPLGGMFLWLRILGVEDTYKMAVERGLQHKLAVMPGSEFSADRSRPSPFIRLAYSVIAEDRMDEVSVK